MAFKEKHEHEPLDQENAEGLQNEIAEINEQLDVYQEKLEGKPLENYKIMREINKQFPRGTALNISDAGEPYVVLRTLGVENIGVGLDNCVVFLSEHGYGKFFDIKRDAIGNLKYEEHNLSRHRADIEQGHIKMTPAIADMDSMVRLRASMTGSDGKDMGFELGCTRMVDFGNDQSVIEEIANIAQKCDEAHSEKSE